MGDIFSDSSRCNTCYRKIADVYCYVCDKELIEKRAKDIKKKLKKKQKSPSNTYEPKPKKNKSKPVWDIVIDDMKKRDKFGRKKHGTPLQANNGRDALVDLYQELLDAVVYTRQAIMERDGK